MVIDVFSKYGYAIPIKNKTGSEMVNAFNQLWSNGMPDFRLLWNDDIFTVPYTYLNIFAL